MNPRPQGYKPPGGGGVKSDSIRESANPAPGIFLAKARGTPASIASFRENILKHKKQENGYLQSFDRQLIARASSHAPESPVTNPNKVVKHQQSANITMEYMVNIW